ncbi:phosphatase [Rhizobium sp. Root274]|uniref:metallophosphoesterase n=1 Tax=unclassified Rhizobium TaxID=2613769 RepID=UPI000713B364|nr:MULTISPECIES: metallophosphoesterase [unclassified Rhizobium]KQW31485.1 phosphatase [Rhizobium sp. Root1240]KRD33027.1 phosphatase [Rhizobium sp. Root274]
MTQERLRLSLGIIADPQYADREPDLDLDRHFREVPARLKQAIEHFDTLPLDAIVVLGDLIDRDFESFEPVLEILGQSRHPRILLPGNHDFSVSADRLADIHATLGMPAPYYEYRLKGLRILIIEGNEISLFSSAPEDPRHIEAEARVTRLRAAGAPNAQDWNAGISATQEGWIRDRLADAAAAGEPVILLGHYPIHPPSDHNLWDSERLAELVASSPAALAYLCGHQHKGNYATLDAAHFVNFCGMVDTADSNAFAVLEIYDDRIEITGLGREPSRRLALGVSSQ